MPTEAEREYAVGEGGFGQENTFYGSNDPDTVAWYGRNSVGMLHPVGMKAPNKLGIFDMTGNVWEWCWDFYGPYSSEFQENPRGPEFGTYHTLRGGSWDRVVVSGCLDIAFRAVFGPGRTGDAPGFRLARSH